MPKSATGAQAPAPKTSSESGCHPKGAAPPSCAEAFFAAAITHLVGARQLSFGHVLKGMPLATAIEVFATTVNAEGRTAPATGSLDPRHLLYTTRLSEILETSARRYSYAGIIQFFQTHVLDAKTDGARLLRAFPIENWIPHISLEYLWSLIAQMPYWEDDASASSAPALERAASGTRCHEMGRAHAVVLLSAAIASGFVSTERLETHGQNLDPMGHATVLLEDIGPKRVLETILAPAAEAFGILNAHSAWEPERDTTPQDPPSLARVRAAGRLAVPFPSEPLLGFSLSI